MLPRSCPRLDHFVACLNPGALLFLKEAFVEASVQTFSAGQYIKHFQYGCGVIAESDPNHIYGIKKFVTSLMVVERAEGVPPKRPCARRIKKTAPAQVFPGLVLGAK